MTPPVPAGELVGLAAVREMSAEAPSPVFAVAGDAKMLPLEARLVVGAPKMLEPLPPDFATAGDPNRLSAVAELAAAAPKMLEPPVSSFDVAGDSNIL